MRESALFLLGLLVARIVGVPVNASRRCGWLLAETRKGMIVCVRAHASASFYKLAKGSVTDSLGEYRCRYTTLFPSFFFPTISLQRKNCTDVWQRTDVSQEFILIYETRVFLFDD